MPLIGGDFVELRDCVFIKGFPSNCSFNISDVRKYFEEKVGECCVQMTALSKDKRWSFITLKFESSSIAENVIERFSGNYVYGHRVTMSYWRVPKNMTHAGRFIRNSHTSHSERWSDERSFDKETEKSSRYKDDFSRDKNFGTTNHMSRDTVSYNDEEQFSKDPDNFREYQESNFSERYTSNTSENFGYNEHWNSDGEGEGRFPIFGEDKSGWDSDYSVGNENFSDREYYADYERGEELPYAHEEGHWQEREVDHGRDHYFVDQDDSKDYESNLDEYDSYSEQYDYDAGHYGYNERPFEDTDEESSYTGSYRSEDLCATNRQWHDGRDFTNTQDSHARNQEYNRSSSPLLNETRQWPRWETIAPGNPTRRRLSDPDVITDTPKDNPWAQHPRTCNMTRELTDRRAPALLEERPHSDEWLRNTHRPYKDRGRRSASPVNFHPKVYGHRGSPLMDKNFKTSPEISYKTDHSNRGRNRIFPSRGRHSSANRGGSSRSSSTERSSDFTVHKTSPGRERSRKAFNEHGLEQRKKESRSYSPNPNAKMPLLRGRSHDGGRGGRRDVDLRRSLILHQQRKHSSFRQRDRDEGVKFSEGGSKTSPDKRDRSPASYSTIESSTSTQSTNRKLHKCDREKRRKEIETTKKRRNDSQNNSDNASTYSDAENVIGDSNRSKRKKTASESRNRPSPNQKRKLKQKGEHVTDTSNTKRADRLLSDLAVTLAEGNISVRKPKDRATNGSNPVQRKSVDSEKGRITKPSGQLEGSPRSERSCQGQRKTATVTENLPSVDTVENVSCASETVEDWSNIEETPEGEITTPENDTSQLEVQSYVDSSDQDMENDAEFDSSNEFSEENFDYADEGAQSDDASPENHNIFDIKKTCTFIVDDFEKTDEVQETNFESYPKVSARKSEADFIAKMVDLDEANSIQENCQYDQRTTTDESYEEPACNSDNFTSSDQNEVKEKMNYTEKSAQSEMMSTNLQHVRMNISPVKENCTRPEVLPSQINVGSIEVSADALKQGSYNTEDHNCNNNGNMAVWYTEREQVDIHTEKKQGLTKIDNGVDHPEINNLDKESDSIDRCNLQCIDGKSNVLTDVSYAVEKVPELKNNVNYFECEENGISLEQEAYILEGAKVTQREVYDESDIDHVYYSKSEEYNVNYGKFYDTNKEQVCVEGGSVTQRKLNNQVGIGEDDNSDSKGDNMEGAMVDANKLEHCDVGSINAVYKEKGNGIICSLKDEEINSEDVGFYSFDTQQEVRYMESKYVLSSVNNAKQKRHSLENFDFTSDDWKCNGKEREAFNFQDSCVTQQEERNSVHGETRSSSWTGSKTAVLLSRLSPITDTGTVKTSASSISNSSVSQPVNVCHNVVAEHFKQVDMEISSDEEHQDNFIGASIGVDTDINPIDNGGCRPYSPSSPTLRSDEQRSPLPKDDVSLYSPSHPTTVSEGASEVSITIEDVSYEDDKPERDTPLCDTMEVVYPENNSRNRDNGEVADILPFNPSINGDSERCKTTSSVRFSSSPKSGNGFTDVNFPTKDLTEIPNVTFSSGKEEDGVGDSEVSKDSLKPSRCQTRTHSSPASFSMDTKPKTVYVTAAKTYDLYTYSGAQQKPRIFYATNIKTTEPVRSLSLDSALRKSWPLRANSLHGSKNTSIQCKQQPTFDAISATESEKKKEEKDLDGYVEPSNPDRSFYSNAPLKTGKIMAQDGDQEVLKISTTPNSVKTDAVNVFQVIGPDNCINCGETGDIFSVSKEPVAPHSKTDEETISLESASENKSLFIQATSETLLKDVPTDQSLSTDQSPSYITGKEKLSVSNMSRGSGEIPVTLELAEKKLFTSAGESSSFGVSDEGTSFSKISVQAEGTVSKVESGDEKDVQTERFIDISQLSPHKTVQVLPDSAPCPAKKRTHPDSTREAAHPNKIPRKPLKLTIPATPLSNRSIKRKPQPAYLGRCYKKTSTSTVTRLTADLVPKKHLSQGDVSAVTEQDSFIELSPTLRATPTITDALLPACPTGNTSPLKPQISPNNRTPTVTNSTIREHKVSGVAMDDRASSSSKESNWVALKMKKLQKKKEEIEQVYKRECRTVVNVVKMLVSNDPRLEGLLQNAVRRSLQEMGRRCVQELEKQARPGN